MVILVLPYKGFSQNDTINMVDAEDRKQGYWIYYGKDRPEAGFPENGIIEEGRYLDNRKEGVWIKYHIDGRTIKIIGDYKNNIPSGEYVIYYASGKIKRKGCIVKEKFLENCPETWYFESGTIKQIRNNDSTICYFENGCFKFISTTVRDDLSKTRIILYDQDSCDVIKDTIYEYMNRCKGIVYERSNCSINKVDSADTIDIEEIDEFYKTPPQVTTPKTKGKAFNPNDYNRIYNENDEIWQDGAFKNGGLWNGKVYVYDSDGILMRSLIYKEGKYYTDGQL